MSISTLFNLVALSLVAVLYLDGRVIHVLNSDRRKLFLLTLIVIFIALALITSGVTV